MVHSPRTYTSHKPFQGGQPWKLWADTTTTPHHHGASCAIFRSTITIGMNLIIRLIEIALFQRAQSLCAYIAPLSLSTYLRDSKVKGGIITPTVPMKTIPNHCVSEARLHVVCCWHSPFIVDKAVFNTLLKSRTLRETNQTSPFLYGCNTKTLAERSKRANRMWHVGKRLKTSFIFKIKRQHLKNK